MAVKEKLAKQASRVIPVSSILVGPSDARRMLSALLAQLRSDAADLALLTLWAWCTVPVARMAHGQYGHLLPRALVSGGKGDGDDDNDKARVFEGTYLYLLAAHFQQACRIALLVSAADLADTVLTAASDDPSASLAGRIRLGSVVAKVAYTVWIAERLSKLKRYLLSVAVRSRPESLGRAKIYDRLLNAALGFVAFMFLVDALDADMGAGLTSIFAMGGMGTLVFGIASKDLAAQLVSGLFLSTSDKFYEGDYVRLGDGTSGTVVRVSWFHTVFRVSDESNVKIPNSQIANMRVSNLSRVPTCQVKQTLWFALSDADRMESVTSDIRDEVRGACPDLITDGTRPFRVCWTDYSSDRLEVMVDCRFRLKPLGDPYWENRGRVLEAIRVALKKNGVEPAMPSRLHVVDQRTATATATAAATATE